MRKLLSVTLSIILIVACLFTLSACKGTITPMLEIPNQSVEDGKVTVNLAIDKAGWLVLLPATAGGDPDTSEMQAAEYIPHSVDDISIDLTIPVTIGEDQTIFVRLYYDDPEDKDFEPSDDNTTDPLVTTASGAAVQASFTVPGISPYIEMEQNATTGIITITTAIDRVGWLILRPATAEGEVDTSTVLEPAVYLTAAREYTLNVTLPSRITEGSTIYALLYYDDPADGAFTYTPSGTDDPPVLVGGSIVTESHVVGE